MCYRRANSASGTYFFPLALAERESTLLIEHVDRLREVVAKVRQRHPTLLTFMPWLFCPIIFTLSGICLRITRTSRNDGLRSKPIFPVDYRRRSTSGQAGLQSLIGEYGKDVIGNIRFGMSRICKPMWIISITTRSSTGMLNAQATGHIQSFTVISVWDG